MVNKRLIEIWKIQGLTPKEISAKMEMIRETFHPELPPKEAPMSFRPTQENRDRLDLIRKRMGLMNRSRWINQAIEYYYEEVERKKVQEEFEMEERKKLGFIPKS